jgi:hypothetical protein
MDLRLVALVKWQSPNGNQERPVHEVLCPTCSETVKFADEKIGSKLRCFKCGTRFIVEESRPGEFHTRDVAAPARVARRPGSPSAGIAEEDLVQFDPAEGERTWAHLYLNIWKWSAVMAAIGLFLAAICFFLVGLSYSSQPTTSAYGSSLLWNSLWCLLLAPAEIISSFGLIDLARAVLNIESMLLEEDKGI